MASSIGIKIANGEFYPLVEENSSVKKKLILTTVHDNQPSVQIDLFRSPESDMVDAQYIGTVVVENIKPKKKGEPSIEMVISSDEQGNIIADAIDLDSGARGEHYVLTVSLKSMDATPEQEIQDFELEANEAPPLGLYNHAEKIRNEKKYPAKSGVIILLGLFLLLGLLAMWMFLFGGLELIRSLDRQAVAQTVPEPVRQPDPEPARQPEPVIHPEPVRQPEPEPVQQVIQTPPVIQAPAAVPAPAPRPAARADGNNASVAAFNVPSVIPREGINYIIRWGDSLWDISEAFYRDPWLYQRIARHNSIANPNLIISGRTIRIPPRN